MAKHMNKKKRNTPQVVKDTIAAVRRARIAAGMNNDQRFHEKRVNKDRIKIRDGISKRETHQQVRD